MIDNSIVDRRFHYRSNALTQKELLIFVTIFFWVLQNERSSVNFADMYSYEFIYKNIILFIRGSPIK